MKLALKPPIPPMETELVPEIPEGAAWQYEPKWDGFRCLAFRDGRNVYLQSKAERPLARYFPGIFRHGTTFLRWRPDKAPHQRTFAQVGHPGAAELRLLERNA